MEDGGDVLISDGKGITRYIIVASYCGTVVLYSGTAVHSTYMYGRLDRIFVP